MIYETLQILKEQLENYYEDVGLTRNIVLDNIALWESGSEDADRIKGRFNLINMVRKDDHGNICRKLNKKSLSEQLARNSFWVSGRFLYRIYLPIHGNDANYLQT